MSVEIRIEALRLAIGAVPAGSSYSNVIHAAMAFEEFLNGRTSGLPRYGSVGANMPVSAGLGDCAAVAEEK